jgi:hypothetical protein
MTEGGEAGASAVGRDEGFLAAILAFAVLAVTAHAGGAYLPSTWGWCALGPLAAASAAIVFLKRFEVNFLDLVYLGALFLLALWTVFSVWWSDSVPRSFAEAERDLVYISTLTALLLLARKRSVGQLGFAVILAVGAICGSALLTRLFPDVFGLDTGAGYRLSRPIGYWNALGITAAMGMLLALGLLVSARRAVVRAFASCALVVLVSAFYFTFSRTAWIALFTGVVVALVLEKHRARLLVHAAVVVPLLGAAVWCCSSFRWLNDSGAGLPAATHDGHRLALILVGLVVVAALVPAAIDWLSLKVTLLGVARTGAAAVLGAVALAVLIVGLVQVGGPAGLWTRASDAFRASPWTPDSNLQGRLFTLSGHSRVDYWRVAWSESTTHPWLGSGAGTYDLYWTRHRPIPVNTLDAHNLYLETLAELGPIGLLLLVAFLATPLVALYRARGDPWVAYAGGAYVAFLLAAGVDWYWEIPTVTIVALCCGTIAVAAARSSATQKIGWWARGVALGTLAAAAAAAGVIYVGNVAIAEGARDAEAGRFVEAIAADRRGLRWMPWSAVAWQSLGRAERALGQSKRAQASFTKGTRKDPRDWTIWYDLSLVTRGSRRARALATMRHLNPLAPSSRPHG